MCMSFAPGTSRVKRQNRVLYLIDVHCTTCNAHTVNTSRREETAAAGQWLRAARKQAGYDSLGAFASALGIDPSQVSRYEVGATRVPDDRAVRIADVLGLDVIKVRRALRLWVPEDTAEAVPTMDE